MFLEKLAERYTFAAGEVGRKLRARQDLARYQIGVAACENMVALIEGGLTRRPGFQFVLELKDQNVTGALIPFRYSGTDSYMLVINGGKARVLRNGGFVTTGGGSPYEFDVPWTDADI